MLWLGQNVATMMQQNMFLKGHEFSFDLPEGWEDQSVYTFRGPDIGEQEHKLVLTIDRVLLQDTVTKFAKEKTAPILDHVKGLEVLKNEEITLEDGNPTFEFVVKWVPADEFVVFKKYVFVLCNEMGFTFNCDFSKKTYKILAGQMNDIIETLLPGTFEQLDE